MTKNRKYKSLNNTKKSYRRDFWIFESWTATGCGFHKNKKKILPRKEKHKGHLNDGF